MTTATIATRFATKLSNQLYHSTFASFSLAVQRHRTALQIDMRNDPLPSAGEFWGNQILDCDRAMEIFKTLPKDDCINQMREKGLGQFADALQYNDCSFLAY